MVIETSHPLPTPVIEDDPNTKNPDVMDTPEDVPDSNDENIDQDYPGFPHNPSDPDKIGDDIEEPQNNDVEKISRPDSDEMDADITKTDLAMLGNKNQDMDMGPDEKIPDELQRAGFDLDVPGSELDDDNEAVGAEDEENNYYSVGGDNHNKLEEDEQ